MRCPIEPPTPESLARAADRLCAGDLVIIPTDTVYGVAAHAGLDSAVAAIAAAKGRPEGMPLQLLFDDDIDRLAQWADLPEGAIRFFEAEGPGPWTLILPARSGWSSPALAGGTTVGVRIPDQPVVWDLVRAIDAPLAASSANRHGDPSPATASAAAASLGDVCAFAIDAGPAPAGIDSTVIDLASAPPRILREGALERHQVARRLGVTDIEVVRSVRPPDGQGGTP